MKNKEGLLIFDVESNGLLGEPFAVGALVADRKGKILDTFELLSLDEKERVNTPFVIDNILPHLEGMRSCHSGREMRNQFFQFYIKWAAECEIFSDVNFPVETGFLKQVALDDLEERQWVMPYPLLDIVHTVPIHVDRALFYEAHTGSPLRKHHPVDDCKASLYCLINYISIMREATK